MALKLLIHVAEDTRWEVAVVNAINFLKSLKEGEEGELVMVANANAVTRCVQCEPELFKGIRQVVLDGGQIYVCENALRKFGIPKDRLPEVFKTVPAGIRALVEFQIQGYHYVRP